VLPLHPPTTQGLKRHYGCLQEHRHNPAGGYKCHAEAATGVSRKSKRHRRVNFEFLTGSK